MTVFLRRLCLTSFVYMAPGGGGTGDGDTDWLVYLRRCAASHPRPSMLHWLHRSLLSTHWRAAKAAFLQRLLSGGCASSLAAYVAIEPYVEWVRAEFFSPAHNLVLISPCNKRSMSTNLDSLNRDPCALDKVVLGLIHSWTLLGARHLGLILLTMIIMIIEAGGLTRHTMKTIPLCIFGTKEI